jgi:hypothetical protein
LSADQTSNWVRPPERLKERIPVNETVKKVLYWTPRVLGLLFAIFISLFALDVFMEGYSFWETIWAFFMHLIPTAIFLLALAIAWRWEWIGGVLFILLGILYIVLFWEPDGWEVYLIISGPLFLLGTLFLLDGFIKRENQFKADA